MSKQVIKYRRWGTAKNYTIQRLSLVQEHSGGTHGAGTSILLTSESSCMGSSSHHIAFISDSSTSSTSSTIHGDRNLTAPLLYFGRTAAKGFDTCSVSRTRHVLSFCWLALGEQGGKCYDMKFGKELISIMSRAEVADFEEEFQIGRFVAFAYLED